MAEKKWYYLKDDERQGPTTFAKLQDLVRAGDVGSDDMVWEQSMKDWVAARTVPDLVPEEMAAVPPPPPPVGGGKPFLQRIGDATSRLDDAAGATATLPHLRLVEAFVGFLRRMLSESFLDAVDCNARKLGHVAFLFAAILFLLFYLIIAIRANSFQLFAWAFLTLVFGVILAHYICVLFLDAVSAQIKKAPSSLSSQAFPTSYALLGAIGAVAALIFAFMGFGSAGGGLLQFGLGLVEFLVLLYAVGAALNLSSLNVGMGEDVGAGEELIGILMFLLKLPLRTVAFSYGLGMVGGVCAAFYFIVKSFGDEGLALQGAATMATGYLFGVALMPFLVYLSFLLCYLIVDVIRAILLVPVCLKELKQ